MKVTNHENVTCWTCDEHKATHKEYRDALGEYEFTCDECHREEYPEQYEDDDEDEDEDEDAGLAADNMQGGTMAVAIQRWWRKHSHK